ncbi:MAG: hypothetical protein ACI4N3_03550, partial [Alphaproteobacteria bacterium]
AGTYQKGNDRATSCSKCFKYEYILSAIFADKFSNEYVGKFESCDRRTGRFSVALYNDCSQLYDDDFYEELSSMQGCTGECRNKLLISYKENTGGCYNYICTGGCQKSISISQDEVPYYYKD